MALKFCFVIFLGKFSQDETNLGIYGIFNSALGYGIYIIGFEYYVQVARSIYEKGRTLEYNVKNQLFFYSVSHLVFVPLILIAVFGNGFLEISYLWIFIAVLVAEHLSQECFRLLSALKRPIGANIVLLIRNLWILISFFDFLTSRKIELVVYFKYWILSSTIGLVVGILFLGKHLKIKTFLSEKIEFKSIKKGIGTSIFFFISSLSIQTILLSGRFFLDFSFDKKIVGVYTFYSNIVNLIEVVIYNLVVMMLFPYLLESANQKKEEFRKYSMIIKKKIIVLTIVCTGIIGLGMPFLVNFLDKTLASDNLYTFYVLLLGATFYNFSLISHYILYALSKDLFILRSAVFAVAINIIINFIFVPSKGLLGACLAFTISMVVLLISKERFKRNVFYENFGS